ncbi:MAG: hypothetical protein L6Q74_05150 [Sphaerotilus natans subsp. sulfidivorans]|uniref:hypothetical protein n=1 Tax=Sphaerotilus sulfidivorans TaxID=639200 RepID=UPI002356E6C5|nr:hypothetical protein [Sphaerotilus sulfidivorans]MCK6401286.1 hypothetical protein [Sphaerotilus sulfidivorans]
MKTCTKCGETKERAAFHAHARSPDGLQTWCKACRSAHAKATYDPAKASAYNTAHKDEIRARKHAYLQENREKERERIKRWARANPDKAHAIKRRYAEKHGDRDLLRLKQFVAENPECKNIRRKELRDAYVAYVMTRRSKLLKPEDIPQDLIDLKRQQLKLLRELKEIKHEDR